MFAAIAFSYTNCSGQNGMQANTGFSSDADSIVNAFKNQEQVSLIITYGSKQITSSNQQKLNSSRSKLLEIIRNGKQTYQKLSGKTISSKIRELKKYPVLETKLDQNTFEELKKSGLAIAMMLNRELHPNTYSIAEKICHSLCSW